MSREDNQTQPKGSVLIHVRGEDPMDAPPALFSNFLGISRVATDVQFEFVFLDLNQVAQILQQNVDQKGESIGQPITGPPVTGRTVAKIIMPATAFVQLKDHLMKLMAAIEKDIAQAGEVHNADDRRATGA